jgi:hypothetical protein
VLMPFLHFAPQGLLLIAFFVAYLSVLRCGQMLTGHTYAFENLYHTYMDKHVILCSNTC